MSGHDNGLMPALGKVYASGSSLATSRDDKYGTEPACLDEEAPHGGRRMRVTLTNRVRACVVRVLQHLSFVSHSSLTIIFSLCRLPCYV
jgi:hypothetical protein